MRSSKAGKIQEELNKKGNKPVRTAGTLDPQEVQNTIVRLVSKCDRLEVEVERYKQLMFVKDEILDTILKPSWREGKLEIKDELFEEHDEQETEKSDE